MSGEAANALFSYGTLRQPEVQLGNYGRLLAGEPDILVGYRLVEIGIGDPEVIRMSGKAVHTIAVASGDPTDRVEGVVFLITDLELAATDSYETSAYRRIEATLGSGRSAWAYVGDAT